VGERAEEGGGLPSVSEGNGVGLMIMYVSSGK
jgi:hypothetical protein